MSIPIKITKNLDKTMDVEINGEKVLRAKPDLKYELGLDNRLIFISYQGFSEKVSNIFFANGDKYVDPRGRKITGFNKYKNVIIFNDDETEDLPEKYYNINKHFEVKFTEVKSAFMLAMEHSFAENKK